jgi:subtilisin family serine protease
MKMNPLISGARLSFFLFIAINSFAQTPPQNWFELDPKQDGFYGVSSEKTYNELLKGRTGQPVIVAVIDGGTDIEHEDLKANAWVNTREIPNNGIDDDKNGYVDDIHGWNFIGGKDGNIQYDTFEITRLYKMLHDKYGNVSAADITQAEQAEYNRYIAIKAAYDAKSAESRFNYQLYSGILKSMEGMLADLGSPDPTLEQVEKYVPENDSDRITQQMVVAILKEGATMKDVMQELKEGVSEVESDAKYHFNPEFNPRGIVGDNYEDAADRWYGNTDVKGPDAMHGTHVAGIIGAVRGNNTGINGVADQPRLMIVRVVPDGDERDKDVANAIRYAADNGAKVVNMSFGKSFGYNKKAIDDAVKYAASKDVLLIHAAGNDAEDNDTHDRFPNPQYTDGGKAPNWIEVGATSWNNAVAGFSCYGKKSVDLWAPGVAIYSTVPDNKYRNLQGTSMSSPVAAGVATMIRSYFPQLTAEQVKDIMMRSVVKMKGKVVVPGMDEEHAKKAKLKSISVSGGVVNAYKAVEIAIKETGK